MFTYSYDQEVDIIWKQKQTETKIPSTILLFRNYTNTN